VEDDVVLQVGNIKGEILPQQSGVNVVIDGKGTLETSGIEIKEGTLWVGEGTNLVVGKKPSAKDDEDDGDDEDMGGFSAHTESQKGVFDVRTLVSDKGSIITAHINATFDNVEIAGIYDGQGKDMTIKHGGWVGGQITEVGTLTMSHSGTLLLQITESNVGDDKPIISVENWLISDPNNTRIQITRGASANITNLIEVTKADATDRKILLDVLNNSKTALYHPTWTENNGSFDLDLTIYSVEGYIGSIWQRDGQNVARIGRLLDLTGDAYPGFGDLLQTFSHAELRSIIEHATAGELAGNAMRIAMQQPGPTVFRHLDATVPLRSPFDRNQRTRGQVREGMNLWFNTYGQAERARSDSTTFDGYTMSRFGFHVGGDVELYRRAVTGVLFGYSNPHVRSDLGKITINDYAAAVYWRVPTAWDVLLNGIIGFGSQEYQYRHSMGNVNFRGSSLFGSLELSRPFCMSRAMGLNSRLTPLVAMDFQTATVNGFVLHNPVLGGIRIEPENLDSMSVRIGLLGETQRLRTRVQYTRQLSGNDFVDSSTSLVGSDLLTAEMIRSTRWGKDWLNLGVGYEMLSTRHWRIFADYDFDLGRRTTSHLGSINTILQW